MRFFARILLVSATCVVVHAQARFPMKYLDDVGLVGLDGPDKRTSVNLGLATVVSQNDALHFEGRDRNGDSWHAWIPQTSGAGWTEVWTADFDHNGQKDLLIGLHGTAINGRCTQGTDVYSLLFDEAGRPVPWHISTEIFDWKKGAHLPAIVLDLNRDGRAEIVSTNCVSGNGKFWTDWSITGVYEARDARWIPIGIADASPYVRAATQAHNVDRWLSTKPSEWLDESKTSQSGIRLEKLVPPVESCQGVRIPMEVVDSQARVAANDPCEELRYKHAVYSDGRTRLGWPWVVIDGPHKREIFIANNEAALRRVIDAGYRVKLLGDDAEPSWLWAEETQAVVALP